MSFGSPTPIEIVVASPNIPDAIKHADRIRGEMQKIPWLRDVQFNELLNYPSVEVNIDREKAGLSGVTAAASRQRRHRGHFVEPVHRARIIGKTPRRASTTRWKSWCRRNK